MVLILLYSQKAHLTVFFWVGVNPVQYLGAFVSELNECYTINV